MKAFISYSHRDEPMLKRLHTHLAMLRRSEEIESWHDRVIPPGAVLDQHISNGLEGSRLFIALVSPDFLASRYCYEVEFRRAIQLHDEGKIVIVPVILQPCDWLSSPLQKFKALPRDGSPISDWTNENTGWLDVVSGLRSLVRSLQAKDGGDLAGEESTSRRQDSQSKYRVKRFFDEIDREDFRQESYEIMRDFFERSCAELDQVDGLRARYRTINSVSFTCTVVNQMLKTRGVNGAHITVRYGSTAGFGDISFSFNPNASANTSNGGFSVDSDEYRLFLSANMFSGDGRSAALSAKEAAQRLWREFIEKAGIEYD